MNYEDFITRAAAVIGCTREEAPYEIDNQNPDWFTDALVIGQVNLRLEHRSTKVGATFSMALVITEVEG